MKEKLVQLDQTTVAYEVKPDSAPVPAVIVIHEVVGLNDYIKEVTRKIANEGYLGLAVDFFEGNTAMNSEEGAHLRVRLSEEMIKAKLGAAIQYLRSEVDYSLRIGVMGFCMGGAFALRAACFFPKEFRACSVFYGRLENVDLLKHLECPVVGSFASEDIRVTSWAVERFKPTMERFGKTLVIKIYPGAPHGFHRHTDPKVYRSGPANDAFQRTLDLFHRTLRPR